MLELRDLKALDSFGLRYQSDYEAVLSGVSREAYEYAKKGAADELKVAAPATKRDTTTLINQSAQAVADKQMSDLVFAIRAEVLKQLRKNTLSETRLGISDILGAVGALFDSFFNKQITMAGAVAVAQSINRGRNDVFSSYRDEIAVYQYSAILDDRTCPICEDLDGSTTDYAGYRATEWEPPIHFRCRCIWVAIGTADPNIPGLTGFPDAPGGVTSPSL